MDRIPNSGRPQTATSEENEEMIEDTKACKKKTPRFICHQER